MAVSKILFNPGINKELTELMDEGGWADGNLVRFRKGLPEKVGGWEKTFNSSYAGTGRAITAWVALDASKYLGLGTTTKYYIQRGNSIFDVTPVRKTSTNSITFAATNGSSTITVTDASHGAVNGDSVTISGAVSLGGLVTAAVLNQEYTINLVTGTNTYEITAKDTSGTTVTANSSDSGNGGSGVDGVYQINVGLDVYVPATGWGVDTWGAGTWGSSSPIAETNQLRLWSHDAFGEDLIINPRAGGIYLWDESNGLSTAAVNITSLSGANLAPTKGLQVLVSDIDRHVIVLGADPISGSSRSGSIDPLLIAFSDQESVTEWEPTSTNTAGSLRLSSGSQIVGGLRSRQEILIWTDTALYSMQFVGAPFTFGVNLINENVGLISPNGAINAPDSVYWMSRDGFYTYSGTVSRLTCSVLNYVLDDFNQTQAYKVIAFTNREFNEVGWFYPSGSSSENDRYVTYNYLEGAWSIGELSRTAWLDDGIFEKPRAAGKDSSVNYIYTHENSDDADGLPMDNVFIESGDIDIDDGEKFGFVKRIIPDVKFFGDNSSGGQINFVLKTRNFPGDSLSTNSTNNVTSSTQQNHVRARSRQMVFRVQSDDDAATGLRTGFRWRLGANRFEIRPDGKR
jgi:hypothetical protein